jgi:hypothetical protein
LRVKKMIEEMRKNKGKGEKKASNKKWVCLKK